MPLIVRNLAPDDISLMEALLATFGEAFNDVDTYNGHRPSAEYLRRLLAGDSFIALAALKSGNVVGGIAAYELRKFEQEPDGSKIELWQPTIRDDKNKSA